MKISIPIRLSVLVAAAGALVGCASTEISTSNALARADRAIELAEENGAQEYASTTIARARDKAEAADAALEDNEDEAATRLASEAEVEAELAMAQTNRRRTEESLAEVNDSVEQLRSEIRRSESL